MLSPLQAPLARRILIVDDEPEVLEVLRMFIEEAGYEVGTACNGLHGLRSVQESRWDAVITDRTMPFSNGEEMARAIQGSHPSMPVILMTGVPTAVVDRTLFKAILMKPFRADEILAALLNALKGSID
jgi:DNA-binding NtrC family response regulator